MVVITKSNLTENEGRYLKFILRKQFEESEKVTTSSLAEYFEVSPPSATEVLKKLDKKGILNYESYRGVQLTEKGISIARNLLRRHRLLELLFSNRFDFDPEESCLEASKIDHRISEKLTNSICQYYNHPETCPCEKKIYPNSVCQEV